MHVYDITNWHQKKIPWDKDCYLLHMFSKPYIFLKAIDIFVTTRVQQQTLKKLELYIHTINTCRESIPYHNMHNNNNIIPSHNNNDNNNTNNRLINCN